MKHKLILIHMGIFTQNLLVALVLFLDWLDSRSSGRPGNFKNTNVDKNEVYGFTADLPGPPSPIKK